VSESRRTQRVAIQAWICTLAPILDDIRQSGHKTLVSIACELNARRVPAYRGGRWIPSLVQRALKCLPNQSIYLTRNELALRLRPVVEEIQAAGKTGACSIASELNARGIRGLNGGRWRGPHVHNLLKRLRMVAKRKLMADWLPSLAPVIAKIRAKGHLSWAATARQLNARGICGFMGGRWDRRKVGWVAEQMRNYGINYEPQKKAAVRRRQKKPRSRTKLIRSDRNKAAARTSLR
jgi:hypothetical protein